MSISDHKQINLLPNPKPWHSSITLRWIVAALLVAGGIYFFKSPANPAGSKDNPEKPKLDSMPISVSVVTTRIGDMPIYLNGLGTVTALKTVSVHSRVDGELINVAFREGQFVHQGDLLVEIDPRPYQVLFKQAEGQLIRDQALLDNAELDLKRYTTLLQQDSIAAQQTATQVALVKQYKGTVEIDQSQLDNANLQLTYARITAPITGRVGLRLVDQGNIIHATDTNALLVITQTQPISVIFTLPEDAVPTVMKRLRTTSSIDVDAFDRAGNRKLAEGKIWAVDNQIDTTTGTLKLKAQFENLDQTLFANQFVNIRMHLETLNSVVLAANAAIQRGTSGTYVYVVKDDNTVSVRQVKTGPIDGENIAITEGLEANDKLVIDGADKLREGSAVKVIKQDNKAVQAANPADSQPPSKKNH